MYSVSAVLIVLAVILYAARRRKLHASFFKRRGFSWFAKGEHDRAIKDFDEAIRLNPKNADAFCARGCVWLVKNEYDRAISDYDHALQFYTEPYLQGGSLDPQHVMAFCQRATAWVAKKEYARAIEDYDQAIRLDPKRSHAFSDRGDAWLATGECDRAIKDYDDAIRLYTKDIYGTIRLYTHHAIVFHSRGAAWLAKNEYVRAIEDFDVAICLDPNSASVFSARGDAWRAKKDYDKAIADYDESTRLWSRSRPTSSHASARYLEDAYAIYGKACCLAMKRHTDLAFENLREALDHGFRDFEQIERDNDLDSLRSDARYQELLDKQRVHVSTDERGMTYDLYLTTRANGNVWFHTTMPDSSIFSSVRKLRLAGPVPLDYMPHILTEHEYDQWERQVTELGYELSWTEIK